MLFVWLKWPTAEGQALRSLSGMSTVFYNYLWSRRGWSKQYYFRKQGLSKDDVQEAQCHLINMFIEIVSIKNKSG